MPPKAVRGAGRTRGGTAKRGGGRGRGKAADADAPSAPFAEARESEPENQSTVVDTPMVDSAPVLNSTPENELLEEQKDPNSSPATQPTETPAPTPIRPPPKSSLSQSTASASSSSVPAPAPRASKFKPRIVRTTAKEREERAKIELEKENARKSAAARAIGRAAFVRGRGGRGRGDAMSSNRGRGRGRPALTTASGPFAQLPEGHKGSNLTGGWASSRSGGGGGGGGSESSAMFPRAAPSGKSGGLQEPFNFGGAGATYNSARNIFQSEPEYPDEDDDDTPRVDIENINLQSDSEEEVVVTGHRTLNKGKGKALGKKVGLKPIRLDRTEHKERGTVVNTSETVIKEDHKEDSDEDLMVNDEASSPRVSKKERRDTQESVINIKNEPGTVPMMSYTREPTASSPPPREFRMPADIEEEDGGKSIKPEPTSPTAQRTVKPRQRKEKKIQAPVMQTEEDRFEWERHVEDVEILRRELGGMAAAAPKDKHLDADGDVDMEGEAASDVSAEKFLDGRVYLFQFPPVLPKLYDQDSGAIPNITDDDDVEMMVPVDLTTENDPKIKAEAVEIKQEEVDEEELRRRKATEKLVVDEGSMGQMIMRESGEVEFVWGGTSLKVGRGIEANFFTSGGVIEGIDDLKDAQGMFNSQAAKTRARGMGLVMGKFVVTPDFTHFK